MSPRVDTTVGAGLGGRGRFDNLFHLFEELEKGRFSTRKLRRNLNDPTSMIIANGTQQATAQEMPTKLTRMIA